MHRARGLGYHPQVIPDFFTKNRVKTARRAGVCLFLRPKGVTVFECGASAKPSNFCEKFASKKYPPGRVAVFGCGAKVLMDGVVVAVAHDEFRGMGLSGVSGVLGAGAVRVDEGDD